MRHRDKARLYRKAVADKLRQELGDLNSPLYALCEPSALQRLLAEDRALPWYGQLMTTPQTMAYFLQLAHWMRLYQVQLG